MEPQRIREEIAEIIRTNATPQPIGKSPGVHLTLPPELVLRLMELLLNRKGEGR